MQTNLMCILKSEWFTKHIAITHILKAFVIAGKTLPTLRPSMPSRFVVINASGGKILMENGGVVEYPRNQDKILEIFRYDIDRETITALTVKGKRMSLLVKGLSMPDNCTECFFASKYEEASIPGEIGAYHKIFRCLLAPDHIEDPWRDVYKAMNSKREAWCPLVTMVYNHKKNVWEPLKMIIEEEK